MRLSRGIACTVLVFLIWALCYVVTDAQPTSRVFPSARWAWYLLDEGAAWSEGGMSKEDVERWMAAHADFFVGSKYRSTYLQANPNIKMTWYAEWFYYNLLVSSDVTKMLYSYDGRVMDGRGIYVENYFLSRGLDPELPFYHLTSDYWWEVNYRLDDDAIGLGFRSSSPQLVDQIAKAYRCEYVSGQFDIPNVAGGWIAFSRPEPFDQLYIEWQEPPDGGQFVLEYVSETTTDTQGWVIPAAWTPVPILSDGTNGFRQDGVIRFGYLNRWTQWKRAVVTYRDETWGRKHYWVRIRCVTPANNTPKIRGLWSNQIYRTHPYVKNVGEAIYLGFKQPQTSVSLNLRTPGAGGSYTFEYASAVDASGNVTGWTALPSVSDGTNGLTQSGSISWTAPPGWVEGKANVTSSVFGPWRYWIRIRVVTAPATPAVVQSAFAGGRELFPQEIYANRYLMKVPGWDAANDHNGDGWVDDSEFANLVNPNATARYRWHSRVIRSGWEGALNYVWNFGVPELAQALRSFFYEWKFGDPNATWLWGLYSDSMVVSSPSPVLTNGQVAESGKEQWEQNWLNAHRSIRDSNLGRVVGGNVTFTEVYAPNQWEQRFLDPNDWYRRPYNDYVNMEGYPHGWGTTTVTSFRRRLLNISRMAADGVYHVLQFNMQRNNLQYVGGSTDAAGWRRFLEHCLAFHYLVQHPEYSFMSIWNGVWYSVVVGNYPIGRMPNVMAFQPTAMLQVDIGQPANSIPPRFTPVELTYRIGGGFPDNIVVGDTATPVLNNNYAPFAGKPVYPTYVFALASGTLPNKPSVAYTVFARKYTKGLVLLKMTGTASDETGEASATTHPLPGVYRRVNWDGTLSEPITQITLKGMEGAILVDASATAQPNVQLTITADKTNPKPLDVVTVRITATNTGNGEARNVRVTHDIPQGATYVRGSLKLNGNALPDPTDTTRIDVTVASIPAGGQATVVFQMVIR